MSKNPCYNKPTMMYNNFANVMMSSPFNGLGFGFFALGMAFIAILMLGILALKGYALWHAAKRDEKGWFIALLIVNTFGILELVYLFAIVGIWDKYKNNIETKSSAQSPDNKPQ